MSKKPKPLTPWQRELLAEYDEAVANRARMDRLLALYESWLPQIPDNGDPDMGLQKLLARADFDADELSALRSAIASEQCFVSMNYGCCGNDPGMLFPNYHLNQALAKREALTREGCE